MNDNFEPTKSISTAVLLITFNRPDLTAKVFEAIRQVRPPRLYVASDGPRQTHPDESDIVAAFRDYVKSGIDWDCKLMTLFRDTNLGCKDAPASAIDWFFENEDKGIILEDDCLPSQSFFYYCEQLLNDYKNDTRVWHISGSNFQGGIKRGEGDYYFSKFVHVWGWATWKDRWRHYDIRMKHYPDFLSTNRIENIFQDIKMQERWLRNFDDVFNNELDAWDYQWVYKIWSNNGLVISPNVNLVTNIGFDSRATHTTMPWPAVSDLPSEDITIPLKHPIFVMPDLDADRCTIRNRYTRNKRKSKLSRFFSKLKKIFSAI